MTLTEATALLTVALRAYPAAASKLDTLAQKAMFALWAEMLEDVPFVVAHAAMKTHIGGSKFFPTVGEIRTIIAESTAGRARLGGDAWGDVLKAIGRHGRHRELDALTAMAKVDPIAAHCTRRLGWVALCDSENAVADRKQFIDLYEQTAARAAQDAVTATLPGAAQRDGGSLPPAAGAAAQLVGDVVRALGGGR